MDKNINFKNRIKSGHNVDFCIEPKFPQKNFLLELSNICNHKCIFCASRKMTRKKGDINPEFLSRILKEAYQEGMREVGFYTTGEPLTSKNLVLAIEQAKQIGYDYVYITTNGALADENKILSVINAGIGSIKFSINADNEKAYEFIHGKDDFSKVKENLKFVYNYRQKNNLDFKIFISFIVTKHTANQVENFKKQFGSYCDEIIFLNLVNQGGLNSEIKNTLTECQENENITIVKNSLPCPAVFNSLTISHEGYLTACCVDFQNYLAIADLNKVSLKQAWNSDKYKQLRQAHLDKNVKGTICQNCVSYSTEEFHPINEQLATVIDFDSIYDESDIEYRLKKFLTED
jgi:radical SAM protein with 4Fe4S-binding SPASM domain